MSGQIHLTTEDFEHIWLRHKAKMRNLSLTYLGIIAAIFGFGLWGWLHSAATASVDSYVRSDDFKSYLIEHYTEKLAELNIQVSEAQTAIGEIKLDAERLNKIPYEITKNGLRFIGSNGDALFIEFGISENSNKVIFESPFTEPPGFAHSYAGSPDPRAANSTVLTLTEKEVVLRHAGYAFSWVAIGK